MIKIIKILTLSVIFASSMYATVDCEQTRKVQSFAERFYTVVLERTSDNGGLDYWTNNLISGILTGADAANGFVFSTEYVNKHTSNAEYVNTLYKAFFNREADSGGFTHWVEQLNSGTSREEILHGFLHSQEFINLSNAYGIKAYEGAAFSSTALTVFVERFYTEILGRASDSAGLKDWTTRLSTQTATGADIAVGFVFSNEYNEASKDNASYLTTLYKAFFNRSPDAGGFNGWMEQLNQGLSRVDVLQGFLHAQEFINLANSFHILAFEGAPKPNVLTNNVSPIANAGINQMLNLGDTTKFDSSASNDSDGNIVCYWWSEGSTLLSEEHSFNKAYPVLGEYQARLTVVDDSGVSASDTAKVSVYPDGTVPYFSSESSMSVNEGQNSAITLNATDNNSAVRYSISGLDAAYFSINTQTGVVTFNTNPSYADKHNYTFIASATNEAGYTRTQSITIYIRERLVFGLKNIANGKEPWITDGTSSGTHLIKDINTKQYAFSEISDIVEMDGIAYFFGTSSAYGKELWKSDGTEEGTQIVKDINPDTYATSNPNLVNVNNMLYFVANDGIHGEELWKSDGTESGTKLVKDINIGESGASIHDFMDVNGTLYFTRFNKAELWKSDGTENGTVIVKYINTWNYSNIRNLININGMLYFVIGSASDESELWKSDGTEAGTSVIKSISTSYYNKEFIDVNGTLYFVARDDINGTELWKSDGTQAGTTIVKDINPGTSSSTPYALIYVNGILYFMADDATHGKELWKSDGTEVGTTMVKDINFGATDSMIENLTGMNGIVYFTVDDGVHGKEIWKSNGTEVGTSILKDINSNNEYGFSPQYLIAINNRLYFVADDGIDGRELWKSDGTQAGTTIVKDIKIGESSSYLKNLSNINGTLYFTAKDTRELWKSDGTQVGTTLIKDKTSNTIDSLPYDTIMPPLKIENIYYFIADDGIHGEEIWKSDGTEVGTSILKDINSNSKYGSAPKYLTAVNNILYFAAREIVHGDNLWKSDGTEVGTVIVKEKIYPKYLTNVNGVLYFVARNSTNKDVLWKSNGTKEGTTIVKDINPEEYTSDIHNLTNVNGILYFVADDGINGRELWKSDGAQTGTHMVKDIKVGKNGAYPENLTNVNGVLYFTADDETHGRELWKSDGTKEGTTIIKDINIKHNSRINSLINVNGTLYFSANDIDGAKLWKTDGTKIGTVIVKDAIIGSFNSYDKNFKNVNGMLYFTLENDYELWKSDGTEVGTSMVMKSESQIKMIGTANGKVLFHVIDNKNGKLWHSDGTEAGTEVIATGVWY